MSPGSASKYVTAEQLFPVVDHNIRRAPISVTFEELGDEVSESSKQAPDEAGDSKEAQPSIADQLLNGNEQILYGPLYNSQALQGYILLCCQVPYTAIKNINGLLKSLQVVFLYSRRV